MDPIKKEKILSKIQEFIKNNIEIGILSSRVLDLKKKELYQFIAREILLNGLNYKATKELIELFEEFTTIYEGRSWDPPSLLTLLWRVVWVIEVEKRLKWQFANKFIGNPSAADEIEYTINLLGKTASERDGILTYKGKKYYVKPCKNDDRDINRIEVDANEIFIYKFLELIGLGPKVTLLLPLESDPSSEDYVGYIVTEDVADSEASKFYLDSFYEGDNESIKEIWQQAVANENFLIEFLVLSLIDDIVILNDLFYTNPENYGVLVNHIAESFHARIIDFYPNSNRQPSFKKGESLLLKLIDKLTISSTENSKRHKRVVSLALLKKLDNLDEETIARGVNKFLSKLNILGNLNRAFEYVSSFIDDPLYTDAFHKDVKENLSEYKNRIFEKYNEAKDSGVAIIGHIPLHLTDFVLKDEDGKATTSAELSLANFEQFMQEQHGINVYNPVGDGHCFYHAVANQLAGMTSANLHAIAMNHLVAHHASGYQSFIEGGSEAFNKYVDGHFTPGAWADNVIIQALADAIGINISILQSNEAGNIHTTFIAPNPQIYTGTLIGTVYLANFNNLHFYSINSITDINVFTHEQIMNVASQIGVTVDPEYENAIANVDQIGSIQNTSAVCVGSTDDVVNSFKDAAL